MENIIKGNILLAEFRGYKLNGNIVISAPIDKNGFDNYDTLVGYNISQAAYHSSWDWIMPVVEDIENLEYNIIIYKNMCRIEGCLIQTYCNTRIEAVWLACVEFVKWYNKQK